MASGTVVVSDGNAIGQPTPIWIQPLDESGLNLIGQKTMAIQDTLRTFVDRLYLLSISISLIVLPLAISISANTIWHVPPSPHRYIFLSSLLTALCSA